MTLIIHPHRPSWGRRWRLLRMALATALGRRPQGFFIPYRYAASVPGPDQRPPYGALESAFKAAEPAFHEMLGAIDGLAETLGALGGAPPPQPRWRQDWFPRLDGAVAYTMVRNRAPARLVEVGSGHSTRFFARAIADGGFECAVTAIDPNPRADIEKLPLTIVRETVQRAEQDVFGRLAPGDVLAIDSSHILMPGSDVDMLFNRVLPALPAGVLVHIHDIFLPNDYPAEWAWRGYNEQLGVVPMIAGGGYQILWASQYVLSRMGGRFAASAAHALPIPEGARESSLWLQKK